MAMTAAFLSASCAGGGEKKAADAARPSFCREGSAVELSEICDSAKTSAHIARYPGRWRAAFDFLADSRVGQLAPGNYELLPDGEAFAIVSEYEPRPADSCRFEAHRRYIDLQYIVEGRERMGIARPDGLSVVEPYVNDIEFYAAEGVDGATYAVADPQSFFVFFPDDPHRPSIKADPADSAMVRKVVVKIKY